MACTVQLSPSIWCSVNDTKLGVADTQTARASLPRTFQAGLDTMRFVHTHVSENERLRALGEHYPMHRTSEQENARRVGWRDGLRALGLIPSIHMTAHNHR